MRGGVPVMGESSARQACHTWRGSGVVGYHRRERTQDERPLLEQHGRVGVQVDHADISVPGGASTAARQSEQADTL